MSRAGPTRKNGPGGYPTHQDRSTTHKAAVASPTSVADLDDIRPGPLAAWRDAVWHLARHGLRALPPAHVEHVLRKRGWWPR